MLTSLRVNVISGREPHAWLFRYGMLSRYRNSWQTSGVSEDTR